MRWIQGVACATPFVGFAPSLRDPGGRAEQPAAFSRLTGKSRILGDNASSFGAARGVNRAGQVVGEASFAGDAIDAFLASGNLLQDLGKLPGGLESEADAINAFAQAPGGSDIGDCTGSRAFIGSQGRMASVGALAARVMQASRMASTMRATSSVRRRGPQARFAHCTRSTWIPLGCTT